MARKKMSIDEKKPKVGITINSELLSLLETYLTDKNINRSKYIENLIKTDIEKRGYTLKDKFEKKINNNIC